MTLEDNILTELATRKQGKYCYGWWRSGNTIPVSIKCLICGNAINPYKDDIIDHGMIHLKESNLLPFL